jgi:hypothetical protein
LNPTAGLNFADFVDCLARIALVGFSVGTWADMFPSSIERINALFLTQMGMLDNAVISANLHHHKQNQIVHKTQFEGMSKLTRQSSVGQGLKLSRNGSSGNLLKGHSLQKDINVGGGVESDERGFDGGRRTSSFVSPEERFRRRSSSAPVLETLL